MNFAESFALVSIFALVLIFGLAFYDEYIMHSVAYSPSSSEPVVLGSKYYNGNDNTFYLDSPADTAYISGNDNVAYYTGNVPLRRIVLSGNDNVLYVLSVPGPLEIDVSGNDNVVHVPRSRYLSVVNHGNGCRVVYSF